MNQLLRKVVNHSDVSSSEHNQVYFIYLLKVDRIAAEYSLESKILIIATFISLSHLKLMNVNFKNVSLSQSEHLGCIVLDYL